MLTRKDSSHSFPPAVTVTPVDYDSSDSLVEALQGQDALVSTLASLAVAKQLLLVKAAAKAGVKRFIPSEFGSNLLNEKCRALPVFKDKVAIQSALQKEADDGKMTYTLIFNGPFLDWGIMIGWIMSLQAKSITLYDGGDRAFSATTLASIGKAVTGVLKHPDETENRAVFVHDTATTLNKLAALGKKATGSTDWKEEKVAIDDVVASAWEELGKAQPNPDNFVMKFITAAIWGEGYGGHYEKTDNDLLGLKEMRRCRPSGLGRWVCQVGIIQRSSVCRS